ncbi:MAG: GvpL/GvpF family gas vesicle protein [Prolixibacteraceae bacterium]
MATEAIYIYGITPNIPLGEMSESKGNPKIYSIPFQDISAIVSDRESNLIDYTDKESLGYLLVHHQKTIENLVESGINSVVPMRLGTIANSREEVIKILACGYDLMKDTLMKIDHLTEIDMVVSWADFSAVINEIAIHPYITAMKDEILNSKNPPSPVDQVRVGMMVQEKLTNKNKEVELRILDVLSAFSEDIKTHEVMNDQMITNSAFLIKKSKKAKFELAIDQLDEEYKGLLNFKIVGPLPFYSFYTIEVKELNKEQVEQAKNELEIEDEATESTIKKAYLEKARLVHPDAQTEKADSVNFNKLNKAYHTMLEYFISKKQSLNIENSAFNNYGTGNLILLKIKD